MRFSGVGTLLLCLLLPIDRKIIERHHMLKERPVPSRAPDYSHGQEIVEFWIVSSIVVCKLILGGASIAPILGQFCFHVMLGIM